MTHLLKEDVGCCKMWRKHALMSIENKQKMLHLKMDEINQLTFFVQR